jgi:hypothetical protein
MPNKQPIKFLDAIARTFRAYNRYGPRSNKKLIPIHLWFASIVKSKLGKDYSIRSLGADGEYTIDGKYYPKKLDITVLLERKAIATISFKFVTSNYSQNTNNYFENLLGESANIRRMKVGFAHFLVLRAHTPYYDKNKGNRRGKLKKTECLVEHHLLKYIKLFKDSDYPHRPDVLGIAIIDFDDKKVPYYINLRDLGFSKETIKLIKKDLSVDNFIKNFIALIKNGSK